METIFRVVHENGITIDNNLGINIILPFYSEFVATRINRYQVSMNGFEQPITIIREPEMYAIEIQAIEDISWQIIVIPNPGINVYTDKDLTEYIYTIPRYTKVRVKNRFNHNGYYIFELETYLQQYAGYIGYDIYHFAFLYPPLFIVPMKGILYGRVLNQDGIIVRQQKEIYSPIVGILNINAKVYIKGKAFTTIPSSKNIHRYELINNKGWINVYSNGNEHHNIQTYGYIDDDKDDLQMNIIDLDKTNLFRKEEHTPVSELCISCMNRKPNAIFAHGDTGHCSCCLKCAKNIFHRKMTCPICRTSIDKIIQVY